MQAIRRGDRTDHLSHLFLENRLDVARSPLLELGVEEHVGKDPGSLDVVRKADHRRLCDALVRHQGALDLRRS